MLLEPGERVVPRRVEQHARTVQEDDAVRVRECKPGTLLGEHDRGAGFERALEEGVRPPGRARDVGSSTSRSCRRECSAEARHTRCGTAAGELRYPAARRVRRTDSFESRPPRAARSHAAEYRRSRARRRPLPRRGRARPDHRDPGRRWPRCRRALRGRMRRDVAARYLDTALRTARRGTRGRARRRRAATVDLPRPTARAAAAPLPAQTDSVTSSSAGSRHRDTRRKAR